MALFLSAQLLAGPPHDRVAPFNMIVGGFGCVAGWVFFAAKGAPWGRQALAAFLMSNTALYLNNNFAKR